MDHRTDDDGTYSLDAAVVLTWCGQEQQAVDLLSKSLDAPYGAHATLVARDPVWRPLYKFPTFAVLLAAHSQTPPARPDTLSAAWWCATGRMVRGTCSRCQSFYRSTNPGYPPLMRLAILGAA